MGRLLWKIELDTKVVYFIKHENAVKYIDDLKLDLGQTVKLTKIFDMYYRYTAIDE